MDGVEVGGFCGKKRKLDIINTILSLSTPILHPPIIPHLTTTIPHPPPSSPRDPPPHLDVCIGVDLMNSVSRGSTGLSVKVEALDEKAVIAEALDPHVTLPEHVQLHPFADVQPGVVWVVVWLLVISCVVCSC